MGLRKLFIDIPALVESGIDTDQIECEYLFHRKNMESLTLRPGDRPRM